MRGAEKKVTNFFKKWQQRLKTADQKVAIHIYKWGGKRFRDRIMYLFSHIGYGYLYPVILLIIFYLDKGRARLLLPAGIVAFGLEVISQTLIKMKANRPRPFESLPEILNRMGAPDKWSFPSGHAAGAFLMATLGMHAYPGMSLYLYSFASAVGISRVYMGVHYPSDVMAGSLLGFISARLGLAIIF